jgi:hypothetical protein
MDTCYLRRLNQHCQPQDGNVGFFDSGHYAVTITTYFTVLLLTEAHRTGKMVLRTFEAFISLAYK